MPCSSRQLWLTGLAGVATGLLLFLALPAQASAPAQPSNISPIDGSGLGNLIPTLQGSDFNDPDGHNHNETHWQIRKDGTPLDYSIYVWDYDIGDNNITNIQTDVPAGTLQHATKYWWRVRYKDNWSGGAWSEWSDEIYFYTPLASPTGLNENTVMPASITWQWNNPASNPTTGMSYDIYLQNSILTYDYIGVSNSLTFILDQTVDGKPLDYETSYVIKVVARHDPYPQAVSSPDSATTLLMNCTDGQECRIGEVCYNYSGANYKCTRSNRCSIEGATCYISACGPGEVDPAGASCYVTTSNRVFVQSTGRCSSALSNTCDLFSIPPQQPEICLSNGTGCQSNAGALTDILPQPRFKWLDADPPESPGTFVDYKGDLVNYLGSPVRYQVKLYDGTATTTYRWSNAAELDFLPATATSRYLAMSNLGQIPAFLKYSTNYNWSVSAEPQQPVVVAQWRFDDCGGISAGDSSGFGNGATITISAVAPAGTQNAPGTCYVDDNNHAWWNGRNGKVNASINLDGTNDWVQADSLADDVAGNNFRVALWLKTNDATGSVLSFNTTAYADRLQFYVRNNELQIWDVAWQVAGTKIINDNVWHYIEVYLNDQANTLSAYIDGVLDQSYATTTSVGANDRVSIGQQWNVGPVKADFLIGQVDEVTITRVPKPPKGEWRFDECTGATAYDSSGFGHGATITIGAAGAQSGLGSCTSTTPTAAWLNGAKGKLNSALSLDGNSDYARVNGDVGILNGPMTLSVWFKTPTKNATQYLVDSRSGAPVGTWYILKHFTTGAVCTNAAAGPGNLCYYDRVYVKDAEWKANEWVHLVVTDDKTRAMMYINGVFIRQGTGASNTTSTNLRFGVSHNNGNPGGANYFNGLIDEVKIYDYALTPAEVANLYSGQSTTGPAWQFTTGAYCNAIGFDYNPKHYLEPQYSPQNNVDNSTVVYPVNVELKWPPKLEQTASLAAATYTVTMQECNNDGSGCGAFTGGGTFPTAGGWGYILTNTTATSYLFGGTHPFLNVGKIYKWQVASHVRTESAICPIKTFKAEAAPEIVLKKKLISLRDQEVTYQIDFSFHQPGGGLPTAIIKDFEVRDDFDANLSNPDTSDDILAIANPPTLRVKSVEYSPTYFKWKLTSESEQPVGWWKFDECTGTSLADSSLPSATGTLNIGAAGTQTAAGTCTSGNTAHAWFNGSSGKFNSAVSLDGTNDWVSLPGPLGITGSMTFSIWYKTPNKTANQYFADNRTPATCASPAGAWWFIKAYSAGYCFTTGGAGNICFNGRVVVKDSDWNINQWVHLAVTESAASTKMYLNGVLVDTGVGQASAVTTNLRLGARCSTANFLAGLLDDVRIYNKVLSAEQIRALYYNIEQPLDSLTVQDSGSLILVAKEADADTMPACTFISNTADARGKTGGATSSWNMSTLSNTISHLAGSSNVDPGFLQTQQGNVHSNASICFSQAPPTGFFVSDYFVTAAGTISAATPTLARLGDNYVKSGFYEIDRNPATSGFALLDYSKLNTLATGSTMTGECNVFGLFGTTGTINLNGQVYRCKAGLGGTDFNRDDILANGDLVIDAPVLINNNGGSGTIIVDGNLFINNDIKYVDSGNLANVASLASLGWVVRGNIYIKEYYIERPSACRFEPQRTWCDNYHLVETIVPEEGPPYEELAYGPMFIGPVEIAGMFFAEGTIYTGRVNLPLTVQGSLIAGDVKLERLAFPD